MAAQHRGSSGGMCTIVVLVLVLASVVTEVIPDDGEDADPTKRRDGAIFRHNNDSSLITHDRKLPRGTIRNSHYSMRGNIPLMSHVEHNGRVFNPQKRNLKKRQVDRDEQNINWARNNPDSSASDGYAPPFNNDPAGRRYPYKRTDQSDRAQDEPNARGYNTQGATGQGGLSEHRQRGQRQHHVNRQRNQIQDTRIPRIQDKELNTESGSYQQRHQVSDTAEPISISEHRGGGEVEQSYKEPDTIRSSNDQTEVGGNKPNNRVPDTSASSISEQKEQDRKEKAKELMSAINKYEKVMESKDATIKPKHNPDGNLHKLTMNPCLFSPCEHGGSCHRKRDSDRGFVCTCAIGYDGNMCQTVLEECDSHPCKGRGQCVATAHGYMCVCEDGKKCEVSKASNGTIYLNDMAAVSLTTDQYQTLKAILATTGALILVIILSVMMHCCRVAYRRRHIVAEYQKIIDDDGTLTNLPPDVFQTSGLLCQEFWCYCCPQQSPEEFDRLSQQIAKDLVNGAMGRRMTLQPMSSAYQPIPAERLNLKKAVSNVTSVKSQISSTGRTSIIPSNECPEMNYKRRQSSRILPITRRKTIDDIENEAFVRKTGSMTASPRRKTIGDVGNEAFVIKTGSMTASPTPKSRFVPHTRRHTEADVPPLPIDEYREMSRTPSRLLSSHLSRQYVDEVCDLPVTSSDPGTSVTALPPQPPPPDAPLPPLPPAAPLPPSPPSPYPLTPHARNKYSIHTIDDVHKAITSRRQAIDRTDSDVGNSSYSSLYQSGSGGLVEDQNNHHRYVTRRPHRYDNAVAHDGTCRQVNMATNAYHADVNQNSLQYSQAHAYRNSTEAARYGRNIRQKSVQVSRDFPKNMSNNRGNTSDIVKGFHGDCATQSHERATIKPVPSDVSDNNFQVKYIDHTNINDEIIDSKAGSTFCVSQSVTVEELVPGEMVPVLNDPEISISAVKNPFDVNPVSQGFDNEIQRLRNEDIKEPVVEVLSCSGPDIFLSGSNSDDEERREGYTTPEEQILQLRSP